MTQIEDAGSPTPETLCRHADELAGRGEFAEAGRNYAAALALLVEAGAPPELAARVRAAMGDAAFQAGDFQNSLECFAKVAQDPAAWSDGFVHLRLGQSYFELGREEDALLELARAYRTGGLAMFMGEDPKYLERLRAHKMA